MTSPWVEDEYAAIAENNDVRVRRIKGGAISRYTDALNPKITGDVADTAAAIGGGANSIKKGTT